MPTVAQIQSFVNTYLPIAQKMEQKYGMPAYALLSQMAHESNYGTSVMAQGKNNFGGIGAMDRDPSQALTFNSPEDAADYQARIQMAKAIKPENQWLNKRYAPTAAILADTKNKPESVFAAMQDSKYASDPDYATKLMSRYQQIQPFLKGAPAINPGNPNHYELENRPETKAGAIPPSAPKAMMPPPVHPSRMPNPTPTAVGKGPGLQYKSPTGEVSFINPTPAPQSQQDGGSMLGWLGERFKGLFGA